MINPEEIANIARAEESLWWFRGMRRISFALLDPLVARARPRRILEAGCGAGFFAGALHERYQTPVVAVDLDREAVRHCRQRRAPDPVQASIVALPFADETFELVVSLDVLPHFPRGQEKKPFAELVRVLKPEGYLLIRAAALEVFRSRHSQYVWERQRLTRKRLRRLARANHLRIARLTYANFLLTPAAFLKFRVWEPLARRPPASGIAPVGWLLNGLLYLPLALERLWLQTGLGFPWGQSLFLVAQKPRLRIPEFARQAVVGRKDQP